jgi:hypothetical protein
VVEARTEDLRRDERDREATAGRVVRRADDLDVVREVADRRVDAPAERGEDRLVVGTVPQRYQRDCPCPSFPRLVWAEEHPDGDGFLLRFSLARLLAPPASHACESACPAGHRAGFVPKYLREQRER